MEKDELNEIIEDVTDWFSDHLDIDMDCLKVTPTVDEEGTSVTIVVAYHSEDWATKVPDENSTDEEDIFSHLDDAIESSIPECILDDSLSYESHELEHESVFDWTVTIVTSILFDESEVEDDEEAEEGEDSDEGVDEYL